MTKQQQVIQDLLILPDAQERMTAVVAAASHTLIEEEKQPHHEVKGCQSRVWIIGEQREGCCYFRSDADSPVVKGLVHLLCQVYDGECVKDVLTEEPVIWEQLGFNKMLSPTRQQGLAAVREKIRSLATSR
jgi:cysteine desulfuration protein SufE